MVENHGRTTGSLGLDDHVQLISPTPYARAEHLPEDLEHEFPNKLTKWRYHAREYLAEFLGTMIFLIFAYSAGAQLVLGTNPKLVTSPKSDPAANAMGWGTGIAFGVWAAGGISGAHLNPAITLSQAVFRRFPWRKVPGYMIAQYTGATVATLIVYGNYRTAMHIVDPGKTAQTASIFVTYPADFITFANAWYSEFVGTALLCAFVMVVTDKSNNPPQKGLVALAFFIFFVGITITWGWLTAFAINPARDLGPRLGLSFCGYASSANIWTNFKWWWISGVIPADFLGGLFGSFIYDLFVFVGGESPLNRSEGPWKMHGLKFARGARPKGPAGVSEHDPAH
jgi:aquaglyceroporin related protein